MPELAYCQQQPHCKPLRAKLTTGWRLSTNKNNGSPRQGGRKAKGKQSGILLSGDRTYRQPCYTFLLGDYTMYEDIKARAEFWAEQKSTESEATRLRIFCPAENAFETCPVSSFSAAEIMGAWVACGIKSGSRSEGEAFWTNAGFDRAPGDKACRQWARAALSASNKALAS
jgi:hypothetical protein